MGSLIEVVELTNKDKTFYPLVGPFLGSRDVHAELGGPVYDDPGKRWWVARDASGVLGFCALTVEAHTTKLGSAYVLPHARNAGVYDAIFTARLKAARELGLVMRATVRSSAAKLFERHGFRAVRETTNYVVYELDPAGQRAPVPKTKRKARP